MAEHPQIELYINTGNDELNSQLDAHLDTLDLDNLVFQTLQLAGVNQSVMLTLLIADDDSIRDLNKQYREKDTSTDVLSFPLLSKPLVDAPASHLWQPREEKTQDLPPEVDFITPPELATNLGDIMISWTTLVKQAQNDHHSTDYELLFLLSHGVLHLVGYDDQTEEGYKKMVQLQLQALAAIGRTA